MTLVETTGRFLDRFSHNIKCISALMVIIRVAVLYVLWTNSGSENLPESLSPRPLLQCCLSYARFPLGIIELHSNPAPNIAVAPYSLFGTCLLVYLKYYS